MTKVQKPQSKAAPVPPKPKSKKLAAQDFRTTIRTSITLVVCLFIAVHLSIALVFLVSPTDKMKDGQGLDGSYKHYLLPGPYFKDNLIASSPHFFIAAKRNNAWSEWLNPEADNFQKFHQNYWRFDKLKQSDLERNIARNFCRKVVQKGPENFTTYKEFNVLQAYFKKEYLKEGADSVRMLYTLTRYKPRERKTKTDTLFFLTYKPW